MSTKKSGGLASNPLLTRTEPAMSRPTPSLVESPPERSDLQTSAQADMQARTQVGTSTTTSKFTFYFTDEQLDRLDIVWDRLRRESRRSKQRVSKSHFVRVALERLLDDFDRDPDGVIRVLKQQLPQ